MRYLLHIEQLLAEAGQGQSQRRKSPDRCKQKGILQRRILPSALTDAGMHAARRKSWWILLRDAIGRRKLACPVMPYENYARSLGLCEGASSMQATKISLFQLVSSAFSTPWPSPRVSVTMRLIRRDPCQSLELNLPVLARDKERCLALKIRSSLRQFV